MINSCKFGDHKKGNKKDQNLSKEKLLKKRVNFELLFAVYKLDKKTEVYLNEWSFQPISG